MTHYTDEQIEDFACAYEELPEWMQRRVTFDQFCAAPKRYINEAEFEDMEADSLICGDLGCDYFEEWSEPHPYGDGSACETLCECKGRADVCPRLQS